MSSGTKSDTAVTPAATTGGLHSYYQTKVDSFAIVLHDKTQDLRRLEAQRNELNAKGKNKKNKYTQH
jgi:26S proteasome regulatory subunit T6